jgi:hypothetical protein
LTDTTAVVDAAPLVSVLQPYLVGITTTVVGAAITLAARAFTKWTHIQIAAAVLAKVQDAAEMEAGKAVAAATDNLATRKIDVGSQVVADATDAIIKQMPNAVKASGLTVDHVDSMVAGAIGQLQARMTAVEPAKK